LEHGFSIFGVTIPTDELIFFRRVGIPPTSITFGTREIAYFGFVACEPPSIPHADVPWWLCPIEKPR